jgi:nucleoside-diphosphate-sugar epimerase
MATIIVTGASGFLGAHYLKHVARSHPEWQVFAQLRDTPLGVTAPSIHPLTADLSRRFAVRTLAALRPDVVVHMAAAITADDARDRNTRMTRHVLEACVECKARLVYLSSSQVLFARLNNYALSKIEDERQIAASGVPHVMLRPAAPYGALLPEHRPAREQSMHAMARFVARLPVVPVIGNGRYTRQPLHVDDLSAAITTFVEHERFAGEVFDAGGPRAYTMDEVVDVLSSVAGRRPRRLHLPKALFVVASHLVHTLNADLLSTVDCDERVDSGPLLRALQRESFIPFEQGAACLFG